MMSVRGEQARIAMACAILLSVFSIISPLAAQERDGFFEKDMIKKGWFGASSSAAPPAAPAAAPTSKPADRYEPATILLPTQPDTTATITSSQPAAENPTRDQVLDSWTISPEEAQAIKSQLQQRDPGREQLPPLQPTMDSTLPTNPPLQPDEVVSRTSEIMEKLRAMREGQAPRPANMPPLGAEPAQPLIAPQPAQPPAPQETAPLVAQPQALRSNLFDRQVGPRAGLIAVIAGAPETELVKQLRKVADLNKRGDIKLERILIVGTPEPGSFAMRAKMPPPPNLDLIRQRKAPPPPNPPAPKNSYDAQQQGILMSPALRALVDGELADLGEVTVDEILKRYNITSAPTWIVLNGNEDHVFPGNYEPTSFFDARGVFTGHKIGELRYAEVKPAQHSAESIVIPHQEQGTGIKLRLTSSGENYAKELRPRKRATENPTLQSFYLKELPLCVGSTVRKEPVQQVPLFFPNNVVYYSPTDVQQSGKARNAAGGLIPYRAGRNKRSKQFNMTEQNLIYADFIDLRCLPTRFSYIEQDGLNYAEWREGDSAWQVPENLGTPALVDPAQPTAPSAP